MTGSAVERYQPQVVAPGTGVDAVWLTRPEVAERLRVPVKTLAQWAHQGDGPRYARFGKYTRYRLADLMAWEASRMVGGAA